jgi:hypothetical protein
MPVNITFPGVFEEEVPDGVHPVAGVATSITAFVGQAARGPINTPVTISSYTDFVTIFGGFWLKSRLGYAVQDFFTNGGSTAVIVRIVHVDAKQAVIVLPGGPPNLLAASDGDWGNALHAVVDHQVSPSVAQQLGLTTSDLFNLSVRDFNTGQTEIIHNLTVKDSTRRIDKILPVESTLVISAGHLASVPKANNPPAPGETIWTDFAANTKATPGSGQDGSTAVESDFVSPALDAANHGLYSLRKTNTFNILSIPPYRGSDVDADLVGKAAAFCEQQRAMFLVDPPSSWNTAAQALVGVTNVGTHSANAALYFPRIIHPDPLQNNNLATFVPSGAVAGVIARTDAQSGVWKEPAGINATLAGVSQLSSILTDQENGELNPVAINALRTFAPGGPVVWGARTLQGADSAASQWKYIATRRLALFIEVSISRSLQWVVFEPNNESLWAQIRLSVGSFLQTLFRQGAFQGSTPNQAYFVKCDNQTTTAAAQNAGIVNIQVGFAPLKPAEFIVLQIQQSAGTPG